MEILEETKERWLEVQFYCICVDIMRFRNNTMDIMDIIEVLAFMGKYDVQKVQQIANEVISVRTMKPSRDEIIILCKEVGGYNVERIATDIEVNKDTVKYICTESRKEDNYFYPRLDADKLAAIKPFVATFNKLKKVGLT